MLSLQERGFGLAGIRELFAAWEEGATLADVIGLATPAGDGRGDPADSFDDLVASVGVLARTAPFGLVPGPFAAELSMTN